MPDRISLFEGDGSVPKSRRRQAAWPAPGSALEQRYERYRVLAASLPPGFRMGTSSWSFPGWLGIVYARKRATSMLAKEGLHEYAQHPLLRTVGIDRSFYAPIPEDDLLRYADQLATSFHAAPRRRPPSPRRASRGSISTIRIPTTCRRRGSSPR